MFKKRLMISQGQWEKEKGQTMIYKKLHKKLKIEEHEPH